MELKHVIYYKKFISKEYKTGKRKFSQKKVRAYYICDEDREIKKEINEKFSLNLNLFFTSKKDEKLSYSFNSGISKTALHSRRMEYDREIYITKTGKEEDLEKLCELEKFLIEKDFRKD